MHVCAREWFDVVLFQFVTYTEAKIANLLHLVALNLSSNMEFFANEIKNFLEPISTQFAVKKPSKNLAPDIVIALIGLVIAVFFAIVIFKIIKKILNYPTQSKCDDMVEKLKRWENRFNLTNLLIPLPYASISRHCKK